MAGRDAGPTSLLGRLVEDYWFFSPPLGELPDPTPAEGPDPYGNPDPEWLEIDWRRQLGTVELPAPRGARMLEGRGGPTRVNYVEMGSGDFAVVFLHGLSGSWQNWLENIPRFARTHRVIAPDLPGFGHSPLPPWEISIEGYGRMVHDLCEALGVGDCAVVGNSMGGFIAAEAAAREPERFEKLVLVSAAGISHARVRSQPAETAARMGAAVAPIALRYQERGFLRPRIRHAMFQGLFDRPDLLRPELLWELLANGAGRPGLVPVVKRLFGYEILEELEQVDVPTLIVWGRNDRVVPAKDALGYAEHLRNSSTVIFDRTGHCPQLERPLRFNRLLEAFLDEPPAG